MEFRVLGPLAVMDGESDRTPTAAKQSQLLAVLLLRSNEHVPTSQLIEELWERAPPRAAVSSVHTHIKELRRKIGRAAPQLVTDGHGYRFDAAPEQLDVALFEYRARAGREAFRDGDYVLAADRLGAALALWRARPLADVEIGPVLQPMITALDDLRVVSHKQRIWAELHMARHRELIGELRRAVHHSPTCENSVAQLMLALYRSGRATESLVCFQVLVNDLRQELGSSPSEPLHQLYVDILLRSPKLDGTALDSEAFVTGLARSLTQTNEEGP